MATSKKPKAKPVAKASAAKTQPKKQQSSLRKQVFNGQGLPSDVGYFSPPSNQGYF